MIRLHWLLRNHPDAVEADLARFWGVDLLDYWRRPQRLSTRTLLVRLRHLPTGQGSAVLGVDGPEWTVEHDLADLIRRTLTSAYSKGHKDPGPHPMHPAEQRKRNRKHTPKRQRRLEAALARKRQREADIAAGRIT